MTKNELAEKREKAVYHFRNYNSVCCIFDTVLIQLNQVEREGLYETEGKTFEKAKVVEIKKDNTTESGNQIGNQLVSLRLLSGKFRGTVVEAVSSSGYLYGTHCEKGMKVIAHRFFVWL